MCIQVSFFKTIRHWNDHGCLLFYPDHDEFKELEKVEKKTEGEWAYTILQHLLIKLAVDSKFVIASYPGLSVPPDVSIGYMGDTSFGKN